MADKWDKYAVPEQTTDKWSKYEQKPAVQPQSQEEVEPGIYESARDMFQGPLDILQGLANATVHPIETLKSIGQSNADLMEKTGAALREGTVGGVVRGIRGVINTGINSFAPGIGAGSEDAGQEFDRGRYKAGFGKTIGVAGNAATTALAGRYVKPVANAVAETITPGVKGPLSSPLRADPRVAINRSLRPVPSDPDFPQRIPDTLKAIKSANGGKNPGGKVLRPGITNGNLDLIEASNRAIAQHQDALQPWMERAKGVKISGDPILKATREAANNMLPSEGGSAQALYERAVQDYGREFTPEQLKARLELLNKRLNSLYSQAPGKQSAALADIPEAVLKAQRDAVADTLYKALDPENQGAGPRLIQSKTGDIIDIRNAAQRRNNAIVAEQPLTPLGKVADPIKGAIRSMLPGKATGAGIAYAEGSEGRCLPYIRRAFKAVGDEPPNVLPQPESPLYPAGHPSRMLPAPPIITPAPEGVSGVFTHTGPQFTRRMLPEPIGVESGKPGVPGNPTGGTIYPEPPADTSGMVPPVGSNAPYVKPMPQIPGPSGPIPQGGFATSGANYDLVPYKNPTTGQIEYAPRWMLGDQEPLTGGHPALSLPQ